MIDNGLMSSHNEASELVKRIHATTTDVGLSIIQRIPTLLVDQGSPVQQVVRGTRDKKRAYRQVPVEDSQQRFHIICAWHPAQVRWMFAVLRGMAFGLASSVVNFNRVPYQLCAVARRWLAIPAVNFYDDCRLTTLQKHVPRTWSRWNKLISFVGYIFDEEKDCRMATLGPFLGIIEDLSKMTPSGVVTLDTKPKFAESLKATMAKALESGKLSTGEARSLRGKLIHQASAVMGRVGRGQTFALFEHIKAGAKQVGESLALNLRFHLFLGQLRPLRSVDILLNRRDRLTVYTDAAAEVIPPRILPPVSLCYIIAGDYGTRVGGIVELSDGIISSFVPKHTYIANGKAFAPLLALVHEQHLFQGASVFWFLDNLAVLPALCKGASKVADFGCLVHAILLSLANLRARVLVGARGHRSKHIRRRHTGLHRDSRCHGC